MANYKPKLGNELTLAGITRHFGTNKKLIHLYDRPALATAADGFMVNNSIYVATKPFTLVGIRIHTIASGTLGLVTIYGGVTENATTASLLVIAHPNFEGIYEFHCDIDSAYAFLTYQPSVASIQFIEAWGYEISD